MWAWYCSSVEQCFSARCFVRCTPFGIETWPRKQTQTGQRTLNGTSRCSSVRWSYKVEMLSRWRSQYGQLNTLISLCSGSSAFVPNWASRSSSEIRGCFGWSEWRLMLVSLSNTAVSGQSKHLKRWCRLAAEDFVAFLAQFYILFLTTYTPCF